MSAWNWFNSPNCVHPRPLELLPIVQFTYDFLCLDCGRFVGIAWTEELAKLSYAESVAAARELARQQFATLTEVPVNEVPPCSA